MSSIFKKWNDIKLFITLFLISLLLPFSFNMDNSILVKEVESIIKNSLQESARIGNICLEKYWIKKNVFSVKVVTISGQDATETKDLFMKILLPDSEERTKLSFSKELHMYKLAIPEYMSIMERHSKYTLQIFPDLFGVNDKSTVMLLSDLRSQGYNIAYTSDGLDEVHTKLVLDRLAYFHANGIYIKRKNTEFLEKQLNTLLQPAFMHQGNPRRNELNLRFRRKIKIIIGKNFKLKKYSDKIDQLIKYIDTIVIPNPIEPFSTISHNDLWFHNVLFQYSTCGSQPRTEVKLPINVKFIDFQYVLLNSPVRDLVHFIYSSSELSVQKNFFQYSDFYYEKLIKYLSNLECDVKEFTKDKFYLEIQTFAPTKFKHILYILLMWRKMNFTGFTTEDRDKLFNERLCSVVFGFIENKWM